MNRLAFLFLLILSGFQASGQYTFKSLRYDENYTALNDSSDATWYQQLKFTRLNSSGTSWLSTGGEVRYQYFNFKDEDWGDAPNDPDGFILNRLLFHTDLHAGNHFRLFAQLQSSGIFGREGDPSPVELNELDLHQLFADFILVNSATQSIMLRAGRQELSYGSSRLVSPREGPNNRQAFDGVKFIWRQKDVKVDLLYTDYVVSEQGIFNDNILSSQTIFSGAYAVFNHVPVVGNVDLYYLYLNKQNSVWSDMIGQEKRHSMGARIWATKGRWKYDFESLVQFGSMERNRILAWTLSSNTSYTLGDRPTSPSIGLKTEAISGDEHANDGRIESFNPLFPRGAYFGYAALIGPSNLVDIHPAVTWPFSQRISASLDYDIFWRYSTRDGIYNAGARVIYPAGDSGARFIGQQIGLTFDFEISDFLYLGTESTWFKTERYLKSVGPGKDIVYMGVTLTLKF